MAPTISLVIPALNEESGIAATIRRAPRDLHEIIVVDGNSKDRTVEVAQSEGARVVVEPLRGYGRAYMRGFAEATGDLIATADADGTYPVEMIPYVVEHLERKNLSFVNCSRLPLAESRSMRPMNQIGNVGLSLAASALYLHPFRDICSGMWLFRRSILKDLELRTKGWVFSNEFKLEAYMNDPQGFAEFVIPYDERVGPTHNVTIWRTGVQVLVFLGYERALHFVRSRITNPRAHY